MRYGYSYYAMARPAASGTPAPTISSAGSISGSPRIGQTLSVTGEAWNNSPTSYARQWYRDGVAIGGATSATYQLVDADAGAEITRGTIATNAGGSSAEAFTAGVTIERPAFLLEAGDLLLLEDGDNLLLEA